MTDPSEIIVRAAGGVGRLTLNRPAALHALTLAMCETMIQALTAWRADPAVQIVLIDHEGGRGFCAGGDVRQVAQSRSDGGALAAAFFRTEYRLNHLLFTYPKPTVAIGDGVVMGGGAGLFLPCRYRIATERTAFAMPETAIGFFPDVGAGWFLPRLPGQAGVWLGLTGARLKAADCLALGLATHHISDPEGLKTALLADPARLDDALAQRRAPAEPGRLETALALIEATFAADTVEDIVTALNARSEPWAGFQLETLMLRSPQSLKITLRHLREGGRAVSFAEVMAAELRLAIRSAASHDFAEGVRAVLTDKDDAPRWEPPSLEAVTPAMVDRFFALLPADLEWTPLPV